VTVFAVDPLTDKRWDEFQLSHPRAGIFHTCGWLQALQRTYDYRPVAFTTSEPGKTLANGMVFCEVNSWATGRRLVSLPFSDHCDPLADSAAEEAEILAQVCRQAAQDRCRYAEIRPASGAGERPAADWRPSETFLLHVLPLNAPLERVFSNLHKDCIQRKVRRAEKEELRYEHGRSGPLLSTFYGLLLRTRRRHCLPPQPFLWFRNLAESMGDAFNIRVAWKDQQPVAAILTLSCKSTITYKYGCSDERYNHLGGTPFLFWKAMQEAWREGKQQFDLGRSDADNDGLIKFKDRLGAPRTVLSYRRWRPEATAGASCPAWLAQIGRQVFHRLPDPLLVASGRLLYRHIG